ncbi:hypothetical protein SLT36_22175 [Aminobacter sp. BA135]|uniref:hypothetical protein n=1 Tax=Aminobacter sp. BA135 TaxID=537596 RepID=UPI003D7B8988
MKTIMMATAVSLMLTPLAFAAVPVVASAASKAVAASQGEKDGVVLAAGPGRTGTISIPGGKGFMPGKGFAG